MNHKSTSIFSHQLFYALPLVLLMMVGCSKDTDIFVPDPVQPVPDTNWVPVITDTMPVVLLKKELRRTYFNDSVNATTGGTVVAPFGAKFTLNAGSLSDASGQLVAGKVKLDFLHVYKNGDLIRMNKPTYNQGRLFASEGVMLAQLTKEGQELKLFDSSSAIIDMPAHAAIIDTLKLHYGTGTNFLEYGWQLNTDNSNRIYTHSAGYLLRTRRLGWIGTGRSYNTYSPVTLHVKLPARFTNANTFVSLVFDNKICMATCYGQPSPKLFVAYGLPGNLSGTIVVMGKLGNQYFAVKKPVVLRPGIIGSTVIQHEDITPVLSSPGAINTLLDGL